MDRPNHIGYPTMESAAIAMHELYLSLIKAGFSEKQALSLIVGLTKE